MLAQLTRDKSQQAQSIYDTGIAQDLAERQFQESQRQFNEQQRAAAAAASAYNFGGGSATQQSNAPSAARIEQKGKNFNFYDGTGKAINAAQYSQLTGRGYREVLDQLAKAGDQNAKIALQYVGNDGRYGSSTPNQVRAALAAVGATLAPGQTQTAAKTNTATPFLKQTTTGISTLPMLGLR